LNAGGAVCVAYCHKFIEAAKAEHCPLSKNGKHCNRKKKVENSDRNAVVDEELNCCPMTVSFVAGPVEKHSFSLSSSVVASTKFEVFAFVPTFRRQLVISGFDYRGPPYDRRINRIKNCIIRI
jgi:hypothetical protein